MSAPRFDAYFKLRPDTDHEREVRAYWFISQVVMAGQTPEPEAMAFLVSAANRAPTEALRLASRYLLARTRVGRAA
jgi:hypothetical protein